LGDGGRGEKERIWVNKGRYDKEKNKREEMREEGKGGRK